MHRIAALIAIACYASAAEPPPATDGQDTAPLPAYVRQASAPNSLYRDLRGTLILDIDPDAAAQTQAQAAAHAPVQATASTSGTVATDGSAPGKGSAPTSGPASPISRMSIGFSGTTVIEYEGSGGPRTITLNVTRSAGWAGAGTVRYDTSDQAATSASGDYVAVVNGLVSWAPGDPDTKSIAITVNGDTDEEPDESFLVTLSSPTGDTLGANQIVMIALRNDDGASAALAESSAASIQPNGTGDSGACGAGTLTGLLLGIGSLGLVRRRRR